MFELDNWLKPRVLQRLTAYPRARFYLDRCWDQLVLYLLISPLEWLHLGHLIATTRLDRYGLLSQCLLMIYLFLAFVFWEFIRIFLLRLCKAVGEADDMPKMASRMMSAAKKSFERVGPMLSGFSQSANSIFKKAINNTEPVANRVMPAGNKRDIQSTPVFGS